MPRSAPVPVGAFSTAPCAATSSVYDFVLAERGVLGAAGRALDREFHDWLAHHRNAGLLRDPVEQAPRRGAGARIGATRGSNPKASVYRQFAGTTLQLDRQWHECRRRCAGRRLGAPHERQTQHKSHHNI